MRGITKKCWLGSALMFLTSLVFADEVAVGFISYDVNIPRSVATFDIINQTGPNASAFPDMTFPVTAAVHLLSLALTVDYSDGSTSHFGSSYFTLSPDGISFDGETIPIGGANAQPLDVTLTGLFNPTSITLNDGSTNTIDSSFSALIVPSSPPNLSDGDLAIIKAEITTSTVPEPNSAILLVAAVLILFLFRRFDWWGIFANLHTLLRSRAAVLGLTVACLLAACPASAATFTVKLNAWTAPSTGVAGAGFVDVVGSGFPIANGSLIPADATLSFALSCGGAVAATANPESIIKVIGTSYRMHVFLPASLTTNNYFVSVSGTTSDGTTYSSTDCSEVDVTRTSPGTGTFVGRVTLSNGAPAVGVLVQASVQLNGSGLVPFSTRTDPNGSYAIARVPIGRLFVISGVGVTSKGNIITSEGGVVTVNLQAPPFGTVVVKVLRADNTAFAGAGISAVDSSHAEPFFAGYCDGTGTLTLHNVAGGFGLLATDQNFPFEFVGSVGGAITVDGAIASVTILSPIAGNVQGRIVAGDGQTPVNASVSIVDGPTTGAISVLATTSADSQGFYRFTNVAVGRQGFKVLAGALGVFSSQTAAFSNGGQGLTINLSLPIAVFKGTVTFFDGTPVPTPDVFGFHDYCCTGMPPQASRLFFSSNPTDNQGNYTLLLPDPIMEGFVEPLYTVRVVDPSSLLGETVFATVTNTAVAQTINVVLPASGTVTGRIAIAETNAPFANAQADITADLSRGGVKEDRQMQTGRDGLYHFDHVPVGPFAIQASDTGQNLFASAGGLLTKDGDTATVNLSISTSHAVAGGTVSATDGITRIPNASVTLENLDSSGPLGSFRNGVTTDASGSYQASGDFRVPLGNIRVSASAPNNPAVGGLNVAVVASTVPATVNVTLGNAVEFGFYELDGPDGFRYRVGCEGKVGASTITGAVGALAGFALTMDGPTNFPCNRAGTLEAGGRQTVLGPAGLGNVKVIRKAFSPSAGGFTRYLEILSNPGNAPATVHLMLSAQLDSGNCTRLVVDPTHTNNTFAVTDNTQVNNLDLCPSQFFFIPFAAAVGFVFSGTNARLGFSTVSFGQDGSVLYIWHGTIPPSGRVILMHFALARNILDAAGAQIEAQALANLADPNALVGMTTDEKANVVNFSIPATSR
jgi:hypothetical protein